MNHTAADRPASREKLLSAHGRGAGRRMVVVATEVTCGQNIWIFETGIVVIMIAIVKNSRISVMSATAASKCAIYLRKELEIVTVAMTSPIELRKSELSKSTLRNRCGTRDATYRTDLHRHSKLAQRISGGRRTKRQKIKGICCASVYDELIAIIAGVMKSNLAYRTMKSTVGYMVTFLIHYRSRDLNPQILLRSSPESDKKPDRAPTPFHHENVKGTGSSNLHKVLTTSFKVSVMGNTISNSTISTECSGKASTMQT